MAHALSPYPGTLHVPLHSEQSSSTQRVTGDAFHEGKCGRTQVQIQPKDGRDAEVWHGAGDASGRYVDGWGWSFPRLAVSEVLVALFCVALVFCV